MRTSAAAFLLTLPASAAFAAPAHEAVAAGAPAASVIGSIGAILVLGGLALFGSRRRAPVPVPVRRAPARRRRNLR